MCPGPLTRRVDTDERQRPKEAATDLARLIERELDYNEGHIDPIALRLFIQNYWKRLAALAHAIHEGGGY